MSGGDPGVIGITQRELLMEMRVTPTDGSAAVLTVAEMLRDHDQKIDSLLDWRSELRGALALMKLAMGASVLSAVVSIIAVVGFLAGHR